MIFDGHIHIMEKEIHRKDFEKKLKLADISGGVLISLKPASFVHSGVCLSSDERLDNLMEWVSHNENLFPFYWVDPMEDDSTEQIETAVERGVSGFKVICDNFYPYDLKALKVFKKIAEKGKPIIFHSGILWDGKHSGIYNRPVNFEALLEIDGLKFSLAHVSWPWCDENIAVYGKFLNAYTKRPDLSVEMFVDITPGTPPVYRNEVISKLHTVGYDVENNIVFGSDCNACNYNYKWAREWIERDNNIYDSLGLSDNVKTKIYSDNLLRFVGALNDDVKHKSPKVAE